MSEESENKIIKFSGDREDWTMWSNKFFCRAAAKGWLDILEKDENDQFVNIPTKKEYKEAIIEDTEAAKNTVKIYKNNLLAYAALMEAQQDPTIFNIVLRAKKDGVGVASLAWENLKKKFEPSEPE